MFLAPVCFLETNGFLETDGFLETNGFLEIQGTLLFNIEEMRTIVKSILWTKTVYQALQSFL